MNAFDLIALSIGVLAVLWLIPVLQFMRREAQDARAAAALCPPQRRARLVSRLWIKRRVSQLPVSALRASTPGLELDAHYRPRLSALADDDTVEYPPFSESIGVKVPRW